MKDNYSPLRMINLLDCYSEVEVLENFFLCTYGIPKRLRTDYGPRWFICDTQQQVPTSLIGDSHTVLVQLSAVELILCLFELQALVLGGSLPPEVNLLGCCGHGDAIFVIGSVDSAMDMDDAVEFVP